MDTIKFTKNLNWNFDKNKKIGHIRADHEGKIWYTTWKENIPKEKITQKQRSEINDIKRKLCNMFPDGVPSVQEYMKRNPDIKLDNNEANLFCKGIINNYWIRLIARYGDYNMYIHCYEK